MRKVQPDNITKVLDGNIYFIDETIYLNGTKQSEDAASLVKLPNNNHTGTFFTYEGNLNTELNSNNVANLRAFRFDQGRTCETYKDQYNGSWKLTFAGVGYGTFAAFCVNNEFRNIRKLDMGPTAGLIYGRHPIGWLDFSKEQPTILDSAGCLHSITSSTLTPNDGNNAYGRDESVILYETEDSLFVYTLNRTSTMVPAGTPYCLTEIRKDFSRRVSQHARSGRFLCPIKVIGDVLVAYEQRQNFGNSSTGSTWNDGSTSNDFRFRPIFFSFTTKEWYSVDDSFEVRFPQWGHASNSPNAASSATFTRTMPIVDSVDDNGEFIDVYLASLSHGTTTDSHRITEVNVYRFRYEKSSGEVTRTEIPTYDGLVETFLTPEFMGSQPVEPVYDEEADLYTYPIDPQASNVRFSTDYYSNLLVPDMTDYTIEGFSVSASSMITSASRLLTWVFSHTANSNAWRSENTGQGVPQWIQMEFTEPTLMSKEMTIVTPSSTGNIPTAISVSISVDGSEWIEVIESTPLPNIANTEVSLKMADDFELPEIRFIRFDMPDRHATSTSTYMELGRIRLYKPGVQGILIRDGEKLFQPTTYGFKELEVDGEIEFPQDSPLYLDLTANSNHGYIVSSSGSATGYPPERAFMNSGAWLSNSKATRTIQIDLRQPTVLRRYSITNRRDGINLNEVAALRTWTLDGWNGSAWYTIHVQNEEEGVEFAARGLVRSYDIPNNTPFSIYRITVTSSYGSNAYHAISKLDLYGIMNDAWVDTEKRATLDSMEIISKYPYVANVDVQGPLEIVSTGTPTIFSEETTYPLNDNVSNWRLNQSSSGIGAAYFAITKLMRSEEGLMLNLMVVPTGFTTYSNSNYIGNTVQYSFKLNEDEIFPTIVDGFAINEPLNYWAETVCKDVTTGLLGETLQSMYTYMEVNGVNYIIGKDGIYTAAFNETTCRYELIGFKLEVDAVAMYHSANNDLWFLDTRHNLYKMRLGNADTVKLEFDENTTFDGHTTESTLRIATFDSQGNFRSQRLYVSLTGPVEFSNGTKGMVITTSNTGFIDAGVNVTGYGSIFASARPAR